MSTFTYVSYIQSTPTDVWHALTSPDQVRKYWFGMHIDCDWKTGSPWSICSNHELMDTGSIHEAIPNKLLVIKWTNQWKQEYQAEGESTCRIEIEQVGSAVKLSVTHINETPQSAFIQAVSEGWPMIVSNLKSLLETGRIALTEHTH